MSKICYKQDLRGFPAVSEEEGLYWHLAGYSEEIKRAQILHRSSSIPSKFSNNRRGWVGQACDNLTVSILVRHLRETMEEERWEVFAERLKEH